MSPSADAKPIYLDYQATTPSARVLFPSARQVLPARCWDERLAGRGFPIGNGYDGSHKLCAVQRGRRAV
jgi:hypothetical protein